MAIQKVCILGATGNVGSELVKQISELDGAGAHVNPTQIIGMVNSTKMLIRAGGIEDAVALSNKATLAEAGRNYGSTEEVLDTCRNLGLQGEVVFVDATADATREMLNIHQEIVRRGDRIATANKNPLSLFETDVFRQLSRERSLYAYNASVMAGGDGVPFLQDCHDTSDKVVEFSGCLSGTLGYICSELDTGEKPFSQIVREAHEQNYTEPHPWDDLNGIDVLRKAVILARSAGFDVDIASSECTPFIPEKYGVDFGDKHQVTAFLEAIEAEDSTIAARAAAAKERDQVLRYVASFTNNNGSTKLQVGLQEVDKDSSLGNLQGTANLLRIVTQTLAPADTPHIIQSKGAGVPRTAAAVRRDLLRFLPSIKSTY